MNWFLNLLQRMGRLEVLVDGYAGIHWRRYHVFYFEHKENPRWIDYLPNVYIHVFERSEPDGEDEHHHPWNTFSIVLKGAYTEIRGNVSRIVDKFSFMKHSETHRIQYAIKGTTTIFFHGFRKREWKFEVKKCENVCKVCAESNNGQCYKTEGPTNFHEYINRGENGNTLYTKNRTMTWARYDKQFQKLHERRVKAAEKLGISIPENKKEASQLIRQYMIDRDRKNAEKSI